MYMRASQFWHEVLTTTEIDSMAVTDFEDEGVFLYTVEDVRQWE